MRYPFSTARALALVVLVAAAVVDGLPTTSTDQAPAATFTGTANNPVVFASLPSCTLPQNLTFNDSSTMSGPLPSTSTSAVLGSRSIRPVRWRYDGAPDVILRIIPTEPINEARLMTFLGQVTGVAHNHMVEDAPPNPNGLVAFEMPPDLVRQHPFLNNANRVAQGQQPPAFDGPVADAGNGAFLSFQLCPTASDWNAAIPQQQAVALPWVTVVDILLSLQAWMYPAAGGGGGGGYRGVQFHVSQTRRNPVEREFEEYTVATGALWMGRGFAWVPGRAPLQAP